MRIQRSLITLFCAAMLLAPAACGTEPSTQGLGIDRDRANGDGDGDGDVGDGDGDRDVGDGDVGDGDVGDGDVGDGDVGDGDGGDGDVGDGDVGDGYVRGPAPTSANASAAGPYKVQSYTSGYRDGPNFADATVW